MERAAATPSAPPASGNGASAESETIEVQVFEHLGTSQNVAFHEVARVARNAIISLPIDWVMDDPSNCHHGITRNRALSWFLPWRPTRIVVGNPGRRTRLIYVFEDLDPTLAEADGGGGATPSTMPDLA